MQRVLILMSSTGDGHRASAEALQAGFCHWFPQQYQVDVIDVADYLPWPLSALPDSYAPLTNHSPTLYRWLWHATASRWRVDVLAKAGSWFVRDALVRTFNAFAADCIVSVHPMLQHISLDAITHMKRPVRFMTVVTDLVTAHPAWFHPRCDLCFVASEETEQRALRAGIASNHIHRYGLPIGLDYTTERYDQTALRNKLGLHPTSSTILIAGGGEGFGRMDEIAVELDRSFVAADREGQLVIICGHNQRLAARLRARPWSSTVHVYGYVKNMSEWMSVSDCLITKAGPGAIAEALACGLPLILSSYIPGQETGNIDYVVSNGVGIYESDPVGIATITQRWLGQADGEMQRFANNAKKLAQPKATQHIVESIVAYLDDSSR